MIPGKLFRGDGGVGRGYEYTKWLFDDADWKIIYGVEQQIFWRKHNCFEYCRKYVIREVGALCENVKNRFRRVGGADIYNGMLLVPPRRLVRKIGVALLFFNKIFNRRTACNRKLFAGENFYRRERQKRACLNIPNKHLR